MTISPRLLSAAVATALITGTAATAQETEGATPAPATEPAAEIAPEAPPPMIAEIKTPEGQSAGTVTAVATPSGLTLLTLELTGLAPGIHGAHIHETGTCTPPDFESAGGHLTGDREHGVMVEAGPHAGDLPNIHVPETGNLTVEYFVPNLPQELMQDEDGSAFIVHEHPDDYVGQPTGHAGNRLACGVFATAG